MRSSLAPHLRRDPTPTEQLEPLRRRAWQDQGIAHIPVDEITDDWLCQRVTNWANKTYGRRQKGKSSCSK